MQEEYNSLIKNSIWNLILKLFEVYIIIFLVKIVVLRLTLFDECGFKYKYQLDDHTTKCDRGSPGCAISIIYSVFRV